MKIKDQIRSRREALGMTMQELAARMEVSETAVRHWESGRSFPGKSKMRNLEQALSFVIDWHEGEEPGGAAKTASSMIDPRDVELVMVLARLPYKFKANITEIAKAHLLMIEKVNQMSADVHDVPNEPSP